ncbi:hypothetical protein ISCGN_020478 [Ixodes scapularis]
MRSGDDAILCSLGTPLLGFSAIQDLQVIKFLDSAAKPAVNPGFTELFTGLGTLPDEYTIRLESKATPFSLSVPRRIPIPLREVVRTELEKLERQGVIRRVEGPTPWCAGIVVVPKASGGHRLCVDLRKLNKVVLRERHMLPTVDQVLGLLGEATVYSKRQTTEAEAAKGMEAQFSTAKITGQLTKFHQVIAALSPEVATEIRDLILTIPHQNPYDTLKAELVRRTSISEQRRLQQLLTTEELGDKTPSQMLRRLQQLLGDSPTTFDPSLLRQLFLQRLPATVRMVLAPTTNITIEALAQLADRVVEVASPAISTVATDSLAVNRSQQENSNTRKPLVTDVIEDVRMQINQLTTQVAALMTAAPSRSRQRSRSRSSQFSRSPPRPGSPPPGICWYHWKFGNKAQKCRAPCTASENGQARH